MDTEALKKLAEAATPIDTDLYGDRYMQGAWSRADLTFEQDAFVTAANPAAILSLIASHDQLVAALKAARRYVDCAYECAFPDEQENQMVLQDIDDALVAAGAA